MSGFADRKVMSADGLRLAGRDYAGAPGPARLPVICLHGLTRNARDFEDLAPRIAATGRRVLALDVRGRGASAWAADPTSYVLPTYVQDVVAWTTALGLSRAVFVGTSMGGLIAMGLAVARPDLISAAVLNDIGPEIAAEGLARIASYAAAPRAEIGDWDRASVYARWINGSAFPDYTQMQWTAFAHRLFREDQGRPMLDYDPDIAVPIRAASGQTTPDLWPAFEALARDRPLLLIRGALSDLTTADIADRMQARAPGLQVAEIPRVGHAPMLDEPAALEALMDFLARAD